MKTTRKMKREAMKKYNAFKDVFAVIKHYFPDFIELLSHISDSRHMNHLIINVLSITLRFFLMLNMMKYLMEIQSTIILRIYPLISLERFFME